MRKYNSPRGIAKLKTLLMLQILSRLIKLPLWILKHVLKTKSKRSAAYDTISPKLLKLDSNILCHLMQQLINRL